MRRRRDRFGRCTYRPQYTRARQACQWCGQQNAACLTGGRARLYQITSEHDDGRTNEVRGVFCSWACAESYHDTTLAH
jgi:hypothetical protein